MAHGAALVFELVAKDGASPAFLRVAGAADKAAGATLRAQKGTAGAAAAMSRNGAKLTKGLTLPLLAIGAVSVAQASKWQKSMTLIQTAGGETAAKTAELSKGLMKLATETGTSLDSLGEGIYTIAKAGASKWSATEQLLVMKAAAQGAKAENVDLGVATDALSTVMLDYHVSASKAVATENELIRASGLAKTNFGLFSESLSNVTPIAAALGVNFAEVGGAIATMTQHGVSAQRATENLRNLLFNLSGQNNVASQAMQQLGIDTVDLAKNLGKRGLTGTLQIVDRALAAHTKNGQVVIDVHKAAALSARSLNEMLSSLSGPLKAQATGLTTGKVSIADYTKYAKSLGGVAGASALQFKSLYLNSAGFSNQLKNGRGTITTTTAQYAKLLGGMTGASVAMQIGGKYAAENAKNVAEVGKAALEAGTDVLGWNKTQDTLAVKMDKAKASLQVMAVEIGTALIPAVSKVVGWVSQAVHWFDSLSGTQKKILGWSAVFIAALGPILAIGGRLATVGTAIAGFATRAGTKIATLAGASETTAARVGTAMRRVTGAVSGVLAGGIAAQVGGNSGGGWLTSIFLGTAGGWALGGPVGAAVGGVSAAIFKGVGLWGDHKKAAQAAAQAEQQYVDALTSSIAADNGAIAKHTRLTQIQQLGKGGKDSILNQATSLNIPLNDVVNASLGKGTKLQSDIAGQSRRLLAEAAENQKKILALSESGSPNDPAVKQLKDRNGAIDSYLARLKKVQDTLAAAGIDITKSSAQWKLQFKAINANRNVTGDYAKQLSRLSKSQVTAENTDGSFIKSLKGTGEAAKHNRGVFTSLAQAAQTDAEKTFAAEVKHKGFATALRDAQGVLAAHVKQIRSAASAAGFNSKAVGTLIGKYGNLPKSVVTYIKKHGVLPADIQAIIDKLNSIPKSVTTTVTTNYVANRQSTYNSQVPKFTATPTGQPHARGTSSLADGFFTVGEEGGPRGWELGHKRGSKVQIWSNRDARKMTGLGRLPGYAKGANADTLGTRIGNIGQGGGGSGPQFQVSQVGIKKISAQLRGAQIALDGAKLGPKARATLQAQLTKLQQLAFRQLKDLRIHIRGSDLAALKRASKGTVADLADAGKTLVKDLRLVGASAAKIKGVQWQQAQAVASERKLISERARQAKVNEYSNGIKDTLRGGFDATGFGSVGDLVAGLGGQAGQNNAYAKELTGLRKKAGKNKGLLAFINQLAQSGQTATLETLSGASKSELGQVSSGLSSYNQSVSAGSNAATQAKFGTTAAGEKQRVERYERAVSQTVGAVATLVRSMTHQKATITVNGHAMEAVITHAVDTQFESHLNELESLTRHGRR